MPTRTQERNYFASKRLIDPEVPRRVHHYYEAGLLAQMRDIERKPDAWTIPSDLIYYVENRNLEGGMSKPRRRELSRTLTIFHPDAPINASENSRHFGASLPGRAVFAEPGSARVQRETSASGSRAPSEVNVSVGDLIQTLEERFTASEVADLVDALSTSLEYSSLQNDAVTDPVIEQIAPARLTPKERIEATARGVLRHLGWRREQLADAMPVDEAAELFGVDADRLLRLASEGRVIGLEEHPGVWVFPRWQFVAGHAGELIPGLPEVLAELRSLTSSEVVAWLTSPKPVFGGKTPIDLLRNGEHGASEDVMRLARARSWRGV